MNPLTFRQGHQQVLTVYPFQLYQSDSSFTMTVSGMLCETVRLAEDTNKAMFMQQLRQFSSSKSLPQTQVSFSLQANALEFQYELCQLFLKKTGQQLHHKESSLMLDSSELVRNLKKKDIQKGGCCSTDQGSQSYSCSVPEAAVFPNSEPNRRGEGGIWRKLQSKLGLWIAQIQQKCSALCLINIRAIISDYRKLLEKTLQIEARQSLLERKNIHYHKQREENLILKQKIETQNIKIEELKRQVQGQKQKNDSIVLYTNEKLKSMIGHQKTVEINEKVFRDVKNYLQDKEKNIIKRTQRLELLEQDILKKLESFMPYDSCQGCCIMLRKLKDSILNFKKYLERQGNELQTLINRYKKTLFSHKSFSKFS